MKALLTIDFMFSIELFTKWNIFKMLFQRLELFAQAKIYKYPDNPK